MKLSDHSLISVVNLGNALKSGICLQSYPKDGIEETDDTNDPISFDAEPLSPSSFSMPYASIEFGMNKASCLTQISSQSASTSMCSFGDVVSSTGVCFELLPISKHVSKFEEKESNIKGMKKKWCCYY